MRAKILMLTEEARFREDMRATEQILSAVAVAFGHSLVMRGAVLSTLTQKEIPALAIEYDALLAAGSREGIGRLSAMMNLGYGLKRFETPEGLLDINRLKVGFQHQGALIWPLLDTDAALNKTSVAAAALAKELRGRLLLLLPKDGDLAWRNAASKAAMYAAIDAPLALSPEEALQERLNHPSENQVILADKRDAGLMDSLLSYLGGIEGLIYSEYAGDEHRFFAIHPSPGKPGLFASLYAAAAMLGQNLRLTREGECLKTALDNVLTSGWRAQEMGNFEKTLPDGEILRLVSEQIAVAGELFERL